MKTTNLKKILLPLMVALVLTTTGSLSFGMMDRLPSHCIPPNRPTYLSYSILPKFYTAITDILNYTKN